MRPSFGWLLGTSLMAFGCSNPEAGDGGGTNVVLTLTSAAFNEGESIPAPYTGDGADESPPLAWSECPAHTASLALVCEDPDAPNGTWTHWVLFNLPSSLRKLNEAMPLDQALADGGSQGKNDFGKIGYNGPAPPPGKPHRYFFKLYALDTQLDLPAGATRKQLLTAIKGHVLAEGQLTGRYQR